MMSENFPKEIIEIILTFVPSLQCKRLDNVSARVWFPLSSKQKEKYKIEKQKRQRRCWARSLRRSRKQYEEEMTSILETSEYYDSTSDVYKAYEEVYQRYERYERLRTFKNV